MEKLSEILETLIRIGIYVGVAALLFKALIAIGDVQAACRAITKWIYSQMDEKNNE